MKISTDALALAKVTRRDLITKLGILRGALIGGLAASFIYDGKERIVDVHAVGTSTKDGGLVMRGTQDGQWKLFRVEGMEGLGISFTDSKAPHEGYVTDDAQMKSVIFQLDV